MIGAVRHRILAQIEHSIFERELNYHSLRNRTFTMSQIRICHIQSCKYSKGLTESSIKTFRYKVIFFFTKNYMEMTEDFFSV